MIRKGNELIAGSYDFGESIIYGDTDSAYVTLKSIVEQMDQSSPDFLDDLCIIADDLGEQINQSFPSTMAKHFFVSEEQGAIIKAGREVVARRGIFKHKTKKRYALYVVDEEGKRVNKLKIMGMETQRSDTPVWIQSFLLECLKLVVQRGEGHTALMKIVKEFKQTFLERDEWSLGSPRRVKDLATGSLLRIEYEAKRIPNPRIYYAVIAADNFNRYLKFYNDLLMSPIADGDKAEIMYLKKDARLNPLRLDTIAVPVGQTLISPWLRKLPIDVHTAYDKLVTSKLDNIFDMLNWDLNVPVDSGFVYDEED